MAYGSVNVPGKPMLARHSNQGLLDNWYLADPINQRGKTKWTSEAKPATGADPNVEYGFAGGYTIDRWLANAARITCEVMSDGIHLETSAIGYWGQRIEPDLVAGKQVTFSIMTTDNALVHVTYNVPGTGPFDLSNELIGYTGFYLDIRRSAATSPIEARIVSRAASAMSVGIRAAKLELGSVQTLAHQDEDGSWVLNDPPPNKALELAKCQRYQIQLSTQKKYMYLADLGEIRDPNSMYFFISIPTPMRSKPTIVVSDMSNISLQQDTGDREVTSITVGSGGYWNSGFIQMRITGNFVTGEYGILKVKENSPFTSVLLDANL